MMVMVLDVPALNVVTSIKLTTWTSVYVCMYVCMCVYVCMRVSACMSGCTCEQERAISLIPFIAKFIKHIL